MQLFDFINSLSAAEQKEYAQRCDTTHSYLISHIKYARKDCRLPLKQALARESNGQVSFDEVLAHFYGERQCG